MKAERVLMFAVCFGALAAVPARMVTAQTAPAPQPATSAAPASAPVTPALPPLSPVIIRSVQPGVVQSGAGGVQTFSSTAIGMSATMQGVRDQALASQIEERNSVLGVLSPAQRSLVAATIGQLAISPNPDRTAAAHQIDATLSLAQRQAISASVIDAFDRQQAAFLQMAAHVDAEMRQQQQASSPGAPPPSVSGQMDAARVQMRNAVLESLRNQSTGSIIIGVLSTPPLGTAGGVFPGPVFMGPFPAPAPVLPK